MTARLLSTLGLLSRPALLQCQLEQLQVQGGLGGLSGLELLELLTASTPPGPAARPGHWWPVSAPAEMSRSAMVGQEDHGGCE